MSRMNGLQAAERIVKELSHLPSVVYCTACDEYALRAYKAHASAYLRGRGEILVDYTLKQLQDQFAKLVVGTHRRAFAVFENLKSLKSRDSGQAEAHFTFYNQVIPVSRRRWARMKRCF